MNRKQLQRYETNNTLNHFDFDRLNSLMRRAARTRITLSVTSTHKPTSAYPSHSFPHSAASPTRLESLLGPMVKGHLGMY